MTDEELAHYSAALDEIHRLRAVLAYEAQVTDAHLSYKTFPKTRRDHAERQVERMERAARGQSAEIYASIPYPNRSLKAAGADECLTRSQWESRILKRRP